MTSHSFLNLFPGVVFCISVFGQTNSDEQLPLPVVLLGGSPCDFEHVPMSSWHGVAQDKTNIDFIVDTPKPCPPVWTNIISNTNLFTGSEQMLLIGIPLEFKNVRTNSGPPSSVFVGISRTRWPLTEFFEVARFRYTNSEAQVSVFFDKVSKERASWIRFRSPSGDGYDVLFCKDKIAAFRQFKRGRLDGVWADFEGEHCLTWMRFADGMAVGKWLVWNCTGSLYMEAEFKRPYDFIGQLNFAP